MIKQDRELIQQYIVLNRSRQFFTIPDVHVTRPTPKEYEIGEITRYFVQVVTQRDGEITEVANATFDTLLNNNLYNFVSLRWKISGEISDQYDATGIRIHTGVRTANQQAIQNAKKVMPAIISKLTNPLQFWRGF